MAASVDNRQFHLEPTLNGVVRSFKSVSTHQPNSPVRTFNFSNQDFTRSDQKPVPTLEEVEDRSSDDEADYKDLIRKTNSELEPSVIDPRDEGTADNWIERNPSMVRLTGKHPFNSEPPLARLMHHGFITHGPLHYVRNMVPVPKATWQDWTVEVCGLVKGSRFTMDELVNEFPARELPVTLVCAGNRRKEQNMVKQTIGFNWGSAGVSTSVWRGVPLHLLLKKCGIYSRKKGALNVCFEGAEDLPGGGGSKYGTSIKKEFAMDPSRDIIFAYMQNGEPLAPDHGFPVRMIIPGFIGGPWWYKPEYIINELNINSVITTPCHEEILPINSWTTQSPYTLRGYAYSGGGKKVTRVEVTLDGGETWQCLPVDHEEKPTSRREYTGAGASVPWRWRWLESWSQRDCRPGWDETLNITQPVEEAQLEYHGNDEQLLVPGKKQMSETSQG
uniref:Nitrate reductase n=1 Tax=Populus alba TaxID=43335 RepID=A0A4U5PUW9_POPAL|nr:hypothetical protein D5086_0000180310 [Populus alba]